jgi:tetratricopeptide (TPR) repeat protein
MRPPTAAFFHLHCITELGYLPMGTMGGTGMSFRASAAHIRPALVRHWAAAALVALALFPLASKAADPTYDSGGSGEAQRLLFDARRAAYHGRFTEAVQDDTKSLALRPQYGEAFVSRADHYIDMGRYQDAANDLSRVMVMHPDDMLLAMTRVKLALRHADGTAALAALNIALKLPLRTSWRDPQPTSAYEGGSATQYEVSGHMEAYADEYASIAELLLHQDGASLQDMQRMLKIEAQYPEYILANYCYDAGVAGLLEMAEIMCQQSITDNSHDIGQYDSLGFVHLRMKQWDKAIADYNKALSSRPGLTLSLYGRGIARRARGDIAGGNADIAAATTAEPDIANIMKRLGAPTA